LNGDEHVKLGRSLHLRTAIPEETPVDYFITLTHLFTVSFRVASAAGPVPYTHMFARGVVHAADPNATVHFRGLLYVDHGDDTIVPLSFGYQIVRRTQLVHFEGFRIVNFWPAVFAGLHTL